jgi:L-arabinose isomerase
MTAAQNPKVGLLLFTAEWFIKIGASQGAFSQLPLLLESDATRIVQALGAALDVVFPGIITTQQQVAGAVKQFEREEVDAVVVCYITWGEDRLIIDLLQQMPTVPVLVWCYAPFRQLPGTMTMTDLFRGCGPVGAVQASAPLKRMGRRFGFAFGSDENPATLQKIVAYCKAAKTIKGLRRMTIGVLPYRCDVMTGTYVDEFRLKKELGPELKYISTFDYRTLCEQIPAERVAVFIQELRAAFRVSSAVTEIGMERAARASLGLVEVAQKYNLDAIAIEDVGEELHRMIGVRPCLCAPELFSRVVVSMEADVGASVALWILRELTGKAPMYTEIFTYDEQDNGLLMGHAGIHDLRLVEKPEDVLIEPDGEYLESEPDSAWMRFRAKGGPVTLLSIFCDIERFKLVISSGVAVPGDIKLLGSPHIYVKISTPLAEFFEKSIRTGMTQHWAVVHENVIEELLALGDILGLDKVVI